MTLNYTVNGIEPSAPDLLENSRKYMEGLINPQYGDVTPSTPLSDEDANIQNIAKACFTASDQMKTAEAKPSKAALVGRGLLWICFHFIYFLILLPLSGLLALLEKCGLIKRSDD